MKVQITFNDTIEVESIEQAYNVFLDSLNLMVKAEDVTAFEFNKIKEREVMTMFTKGMKVKHIGGRQGIVDYTDGNSYSVNIVAWTDTHGNKCGNLESELQIIESEV